LGKKGLIVTTENNDPLSAEFSPGAPDEKVGVRRVNAKPLMILGIGLAVFLIIIAMVAYDRSAKSQKATGPAPEKKPQATTTATFAKAAMGDTAEVGIIAPADPYDDLTPPPDLPPGDSTSTVPAGGQLKAPGTANAPTSSVPPIKPMNGDPQMRSARQQRNYSKPPPGGADELYRPEQEEQQDKDAERLREIKFKQFEDAIKGSSAVAWNPRGNARSAGAGARTSSAPLSEQRSRDADLARLASVQAEIANSDAEEVENSRTLQERMAEVRGQMQSGGSMQGAAPAGSSARNDLAKFDGKPDRWKLDTEDEAPAKYQLTTGHVIPAILMTGINSELPGKVIAQVSRDVYDTARGKYLLIPQGTKIYLTYESEIAFGQASVFVAAQRLVYPDGKTRDLGSMPAADMAGASGMRDQVNNHYLRVFGSSFLMSGITAGVALSQPNQTAGGQQPTARSALSEALGQQLGQTTSQMLSKNLNIAPTLTIRPGYRFNIMVVKDITFKRPYKSFDYTRNQ
jgi:type IV secretion system protein TrbI